MRERGNILAFGTPTVVGLWFVYSFALSYLGTDPGRFGIYWPRDQWLSLHILGGIAALLIGPTQLWLGLNKRTPVLHRVLGLVYAAAVAISGTAALYLAFHTDFGWVFGMGFAAMASAWMIATTLAAIAIPRNMVEQHREWMIRSYVVTFAFVTFQVAETVFDVATLGTIVDHMSAASWLAWTFPLLITEAILQSRKILLSRPISARLRDASAYDAAPEPAAFDLHSSESTYSHRP